MCCPSGRMVAQALPAPGRVTDRPGGVRRRDHRYTLWVMVYSLKP